MHFFLRMQIRKYIALNPRKLIVLNPFANCRQIQTTSGRASSGVAGAASCTVKVPAKLVRVKLWTNRLIAPVAANITRKYRAAFTDILEHVVVFEQIELTAFTGRQ